MIISSRLFPIAEHKDVKLPVMICQDGFITSHGVENIQLVEDELVKGFCRRIQSSNIICSIL